MSLGSALPGDDRRPDRVLAAAQRAGLLEYQGYIQGGRYEIVVAGTTLVVSDPFDLVERLQALHDVGGEDPDVRLVSVDQAETYTLTVGNARCELPRDDVVEWCAGFRAAIQGRGQEHTGQDTIGAIRAAVWQPSLPDARRIVLLGLIAAHEPRMSQVAIAKATWMSTKTVSEALTFGKLLTDQTANRLIGLFGLRWSGAQPVQPADDDAAEPVDVPQSAEVRRLWRIVAAADAGSVRYVGEPNPNKARWARSLRISVGEQVYEVPAEAVEAWLGGVSAAYRPGAGR